MDNIIAQIAQLRASAENTLNIANGVLAAAHSVAGGGAGLPPTAGGGGAAVLEWPEVPSHPPGTVAPAVAAAAAAAAAPLLPPAPLTAQLTLGVATPATFGNAEINAQHYLLGKSLYEPTAAQQRDYETKQFLATAARNAWTTACGPKESVMAARDAWRAARREHNAAYAVINAAEKQVERFQEYYDGTWASIPIYHSGSGRYFIYRFFVFKEIVSGPSTGVEAEHWEPIGLLNPHAYIGSKLMGRRARFLDFVDATQPAPDVAAYWRAMMADEEEEEEEDENEGYLDEEEEEDEEEEYEDEDIFRAREVAREHKEEMAFWAEREAALAVRYATPTKAPAAARIAECGGGGGGGGGGSATPAVEWAHAAAKTGGSLSERLDALVDAEHARWHAEWKALGADTPPAAAPAPAPAPLPAGFSPVIDGAEGMTGRLDPRATSLMEEMDHLEAEEPLWTVEMHQRLRRLKEHWAGRWTTLPDGRRVLIWHFHAFAPPATRYSTSQPLQHLGFYNLHDRTISETSSLPALPAQANWPW